MRWPWALPLVPVLLLSLGDCSKARGDDFSRFRPAEALLSPGKDPRISLRYRPVPGRDPVYQLLATRRTDTGRTQGRMRLRVALVFPNEGQATTFSLRLLTILRLDPEPLGGAPDLGPTHVLLQGALGPRGSLERLEESTELRPPVNLTLIAPLLLPAYPDAKVGVGGSWRTSRRYGWSRRQAPDRLLARYGAFDGQTDILVDTRYTLAKEETSGDTPLVHIEGVAQTRLRSRTTTLSHHTAHEGTAQAKIVSSIDRATGLPEASQVSLEGTYTVRANDRDHRVTETIEVKLTRER